MSNETKMTLGASIILNRVLNAILFEQPKEGSTTEPVERNLPFSLKYKLQRAKSLVEKDCIFFDKERESLIKKLGVESEDHTTIQIPDDKLEEYKKTLMEMVQLEVTHEFLKIKPEDVENIDVEGISTEEVGLFMALLIDDEALVEDLKKPIEMPKVDASSEEVDSTEECDTCKLPSA